MKIMCKDCRYCQPDVHAPGNGKITVVDKITGKKKKVIWIGMECTNHNSEYHMSLLNISNNGDRHLTVTWSGCKHGRRRDG